MWILKRQLDCFRKWLTLFLKVGHYRSHNLYTIPVSIRKKKRELIWQNLTVCWEPRYHLPTNSWQRLVLTSFHSPNSPHLQFSNFLENHTQDLKIHEDGPVSASATLFHQDTQFPCWPVTYVSANSVIPLQFGVYKTSFQITQWGSYSLRGVPLEY